MMFHSHSNRTFFQKKSCALGLILKVRVLELGSGLLQCGRKQTSRTRASLHSDEASIQLCSTRIGRRTRSVWLAWPRLLDLSLTGQLKDPPVPLHVMIRQGSSLVQVQVPVPTKRKSRQFLPLILKGRFPKVRTGRPDHGCTAHFENEIGCFREFLMKNDFVRAYYLAFDWSGWIAFIKSKILITKGMSWPVSSYKWKAPKRMSPWHAKPVGSSGTCSLI